MSILVACKSQDFGDGDQGRLSFIVFISVTKT